MVAPRSRTLKGPLLTHHFSNGGRSKHVNYLFICKHSPQLGINNTDAAFVIVYFYPQRQYKMCVNISPCNAVGPGSDPSQ